MIKKLFKNYEKIFMVFLYLQPFLDLSAGVMLHFNINLTISSVIRILFMVVSFIYLIFYIRNKKLNIYLGCLILYFIMFIATVLITKGYPALFYEVKNLITTYYFVVIMLSLICLYKKTLFNTKNLLIIYIIYLICLFIPNVFNIGFNSYYESKIGSVGWFLSANSVGSILSIILPILLINIKKINIKIIILGLINLYVIFGIGTKVPPLAFILVIGINILYYVITLIRKKEYKKLSIILLPVIIVFIASFFIFPKTHFYKNLVIHINYLEKKDNGKITTWHIIDHFIFSERLSFEEKTRKAYNKSSILEKAFGIGYIENYSTDKVRLKTVEMDYFDVFYRHGIFGFIIFFYPLVYVLKGILSNKYKLNKKTLNIGLSIILIFILALFQGHIFVNPANSIYVALILALTYNKSMVFKNEKQA